MFATIVQWSLLQCVIKHSKYINCAYTAAIAHLTTHFVEPSMMYPSITTSGDISCVTPYQHPSKSTPTCTINDIYSTTCYSTNSSMCFVSETANDIPKMDIDKTKAAIGKKCELSKRIK